MSIKKIVVTGGPCAGKTTALNLIAETFEQLGYRVIFIPETATELISSGIAPWTCCSPFAYQVYQVRLQLAKEKIYREAAESMKDGKILIVCDRGMMDNKAYVTPEEFRDLMEAFSSEEEIYAAYDAVFHLVTAAKGAVEFYTLGNNNARTETVEEAALLDDKVAEAWRRHPHFRLIDNRSDFDHKMKYLLSEIALFLGESLIGED